MQFHSTLSRELLVCLVYHDPDLKQLKRGERRCAGAGGEDEAEYLRRWDVAARLLKDALSDAVGKAATRVDIVGRWKLRKACVDRDYVSEELCLDDGRVLRYMQPEGQFSNPNADCEVECLSWLCKRGKEIRAWYGDGLAVRLLELHCGGGTNTVALAPCFDEVVAVEFNRTLATVAEENLRANAVTNARVIRAISADVCCEAGRGAQAVLLDPPRAGLDRETLSAVQGFDHVLYISCNPSALARDLGELTSHEVTHLAIFDMFPYTSHAECAVCLRRKISLEAGAEEPQLK